jgi:hypothetical protein
MLTAAVMASSFGRPTVVMATAAAMPMNRLQQSKLQSKR